MFKLYAYAEVGLPIGHKSKVVAKYFVNWKEKSGKGFLRYQKKKYWNE